ncbi:MAG: tape measure protein, partial [Acidimicrobiia bacterium]|nr:tape measure protein [Acidimicrobiia bacterium]
MSLQVGTLSAVLDLDAKPFEKGLDQAGKGGSKWGKAWGGVVGAAGTVLKVGLGTAAVATGALVAQSLKSGWDRLTTIQDATAALRVSLGSSAKAAKLMGDILGVVKGTPFNLDQFAAAGAKLAGMGIDAKKVPGYLTAIGEASATQGKRAGEFAGRLSDAFGKMASSGQVGLEEVWSISETGVNALAILANGFGVTRDQMKEMISKGTVPAGKAMDILAKGIIDGS